MMKDKGHLSCESQSDFNRLIAICNSYGLNEKETNQLILEFQKGAQNEAEKDLTFSQHKFEEEQYSFKNAKKMQERYQCESFQEQSLDEDQLVEREFIPVIPTQTSKKTQESTQERMQAKISLQQERSSPHRNSTRRSSPQRESSRLSQTKQLRHLYNQGQKELERMAQKLQQKDNQIDGLIEMNRQNIEIIKGLKDCLTTLIGEQKIKKSTTESVFTARECSMSKRTDSEDELEDVFPGVAYQPTGPPPLGDLTNQSLNLMSYLKSHRKSDSYEGRKEGKKSKEEKSSRVSKEEKNGKGGKQEMNGRGGKQEMNSRVGKENREQKPMKIDTSRYRDIIASLRKDFSRN